eukprot:TRINITY_DN1407_c0_g1_i1.p1 TRINITY_DN1407_c0_g1~~TRINITY_DN1407_c0_g1_i1.p1  ORF type:complete len:134 (+),score=32.30 TRINITY_DN1407_c0_g1_i1:48-404(+)
MLEIKKFWTGCRKKMTSYSRIDRSFHLPELEDRKVQMALLNVTRMLSNIVNPQSQEEMVRDGPVAAMMGGLAPSTRTGDEPAGDYDSYSSDSDSHYDEYGSYDDASTIAGSAADSPRG